MGWFGWLASGASGGLVFLSLGCMARILVGLVGQVRFDFCPLVERTGMSFTSPAHLFSLVNVGGRVFGKIFA